METVLIRAGIADAPGLRERRRGAGPPSSRGWFARLAQRLGERVTLPQRELPPEWFRFPLP
jgi:hypothetical protein